MKDGVKDIKGLSQVSNERTCRTTPTSCGFLLRSRSLMDLDLTHGPKGFYSIAAPAEWAMAVPCPDLGFPLVRRCHFIPPTRNYGVIASTP